MTKFGKKTTLTIASIIHKGVTEDIFSCSLSLEKSLTSMRSSVLPATSLNMIGVCSGILKRRRPAPVCSSSVVLTAPFVMAFALFE